MRSFHSIPFHSIPFHPTIIHPLRDSWMRESNNYNNDDAAVLILFFTVLVYLRTAFTLVDSFCFFPVDIQDCTNFLNTIRNESTTLINNLPQ